MLLSNCQLSLKTKKLIIFHMISLKSIKPLTDFYARQIYARIAFKAAWIYL